MSAPIVCGIDLREGSEELVAYATDLARQLDRLLVLVHVAPSLVPGAIVAPGPALPASPGLGAAPDLGSLGHGSTGHGDADQARREAEDRLEELARRAGADHPAVVVTLGAVPQDELRRIAAERGAAMLVVRSRGHGAVRAALLGSTTHALVSEAPCPVLVVPVDPS